MLFSALLTLPLLSLTFANPLPNPQTAELQLRDAMSSLSARTFFEHDWRCNNDWAKTDCKKKGGEWACDKSCVCIEKPVECGTYCPLRSLKKVACELKWGYDFNDDSCACEKEVSYHPTTTTSPPSHPTTTYTPPTPTTTVDACPNKDWLSSVCAKDQGTWNLSLCKCESAKCPDCDGQGKDCSAKGGKWDDSSCKCTMPTPPPPPPPTTTSTYYPTPTVDACPNKDWLSSVCAKDQGTWNLSLCKCESANCPDCDGQGKDCSSKGGKWDDSSCKCTMPTTPPPTHPTTTTASYPATTSKSVWQPQQTCGSWWSIWLCKLKGKSCDGSCNCF